MAIKSITFENFKNRLSGHYVFGAKNIIKGRNGTGKSAIKDLLAFGFCGTDSVGTRNPTHLISKSQDATKVIIETDRAKIVRTLSQKGNGTIKVESNGVSTTYTQTQLEQLVGNTDTFLSALVPGYFFDLTSAKRQQVLADIMPKVDRIALITKLSGETLNPEELLKYGINRRPDLVAASIGQDRRGMDSVIDQKTGRILQLRELVEPTLPTVEDVSALLEASNNNASLWSSYEHDMKAYNNVYASNDRISKENEYKAKRKLEIAAQIAAIEITKPEKPNDVVPELSLLAEPGMSFRELGNAENCATCGQAVSPRYREQIAENNAKAKAKLDLELKEIQEKNATARENYSVAYADKQLSDKAYLAALDNNRKLEARKKSLEIELASQVEQSLAVLPELPIAPEQVFSKEDHLVLFEKQNTYQKEMGVYESKKKDFDTCAMQIAILETELALVAAARDRLVRIEAGLKLLPEAETAQQIGRFNTATMMFDGDIVRVMGTPHNMLSTGEQLRLFWLFCREITDLMPKKHNMIFVDNFELMTHHGEQLEFTTKTYDDSKYQEFYSSCDECDFDIEVK